MKRKPLNRSHYAAAVIAISYYTLMILSFFVFIDRSNYSFWYLSFLLQLTVLFLLFWGYRKPGGIVTTSHWSIWMSASIMIAITAGTFVAFAMLYIPLLLLMWLAVAKEQRWEMRIGERKTINRWHVAALVISTLAFLWTDHFFTGSIFDEEQVKTVPAGIDIYRELIFIPRTAFVLTIALTVAGLLEASIRKTTRAIRTPYFYGVLFVGYYIAPDLWSFYYLFLAVPLVVVPLWQLRWRPNVTSS